MSNYRSQPQAKSRVSFFEISLLCFRWLFSVKFFLWRFIETFCSDPNRVRRRVTWILQTHRRQMMVQVRLFVWKNILNWTAIFPVPATNVDDGRPKLRSGSTLPIPTITSAPPTPTPFEDEYGDLIKFYNGIFVSKIEEFAKKFATNDDSTGKKDVR